MSRLLSLIATNSKFSVSCRPDFSHFSGSRNFLPAHLPHCDLYLPRARTRSANLKRAQGALAALLRRKIYSPTVLLLALTSTASSGKAMTTLLGFWIRSLDNTESPALYLLRSSPCSWGIAFPARSHNSDPIQAPRTEWHPKARHAAKYVDILNMA